LKDNCHRNKSAPKWRVWKPTSAKVRLTSTLKSISHHGSVSEINQYKVAKELGSGSTSRVYMAIDDVYGGREVAIKVIKKCMLNLEAAKSLTLYREI